MALDNNPSSHWLVPKNNTSIFGNLTTDNNALNTIMTGGFVLGKYRLFNPETAGITPFKSGLNAVNLDYKIKTPSISDEFSKSFSPNNGIPSLATKSKFDLSPNSSSTKLVPKTDGKGMSAGTAGNIANAAIAVGGIAGNAIIDGKAKHDYINPYGVTGHDFKTDYDKNRLNSVLSGAKTGLELGTMSGNPLIMAGGAIAGAIGGFFIGKKKAKKKETAGYQNYANMTFNGKAGYIRNQDANQMTALAKAGMKIKISDAIKAGKAKSENIPGININLIPKGTLHARKNSIGDKGLPVVTKDGKKVLEIEREEIIFTKESTDKIESLTKLYDKTNDDKYLIQLGRYLSNEILNNTVDLSNKFSDEIQNKE